MTHQPIHNPLIIGTHQGDFVTLDAHARAHHLHIVGMTGSGKSSLLLNLIAQDLAAGRGVALLDPHGGLAKAVLNFVPHSRAHEVIVFSPNDLDYPIGFNILDNVAPDLQATVADNVVASFVHLWGEHSVGSRSQQVLRNCIRALMAAKNGTLLAIPRLLHDATFRKRIVDRVTDPIVRAYFHDQYDTYDQRFREQVTSPLENKLDSILSVPAFRNIVGQVRSTITPRRIMDDGNVLIVDLSKGALGEGTSHVIGSLVVTALAQAALSREDTPELLRKPFYLYTDEFQTYANNSFAIILSEARKYKLNLTLGHQYLRQLPPDLQHSTLGNSANFISFRVGVEDGELLANHIGLKPQLEYNGMGSQETKPADALMRLPNFKAWGRFLVDGSPSEPVPIDMLPPPIPINHRPHRMITNSRMHFGRPRASVEANINAFLQAK